MAIHRNKRFCEGRKAGPAPRGAFRGRAPQITVCATPASEKCVLLAKIVPQKKITGSVPLVCIPGPIPTKYRLCSPMRE